MTVWVHTQNGVGMQAWIGKHRIIAYGLGGQESLSLCGLLENRKESGREQARTKVGSSKLYQVSGSSKGSCLQVISSSPRCPDLENVPWGFKAACSCQGTTPFRNVLRFAEGQGASLLTTSGL